MKSWPKAFHGLSHINPHPAVCYPAQRIQNGRQSFCHTPSGFPHQWLKANVLRGTSLPHATRWSPLRVLRGCTELVICTFSKHIGQRARLSHSPTHGNFRHAEELVWGVALTKISAGRTCGSSGKSAAQATRKTLLRSVVCMSVCEDPLLATRTITETIKHSKPQLQTSCIPKCEIGQRVFCVIPGSDVRAFRCLACVHCCWNKTDPNICSSTLVRSRIHMQPVRVGQLEFLLELFPNFLNPHHLARIEQAKAY